MTESATAIGGAERSEFVHRIWPAYPRHLAALRAEVRRWLAPLALPRDAENDLLLAVNEAASNCVEHAYTPATVDGTVKLTFWTEPGSVCVEIVDHGRWRTPSSQPTGRGQGIAIMQRLIPVVLLHHDRRGTRVLLLHPLPGPAARSAADPAAEEPASPTPCAAPGSPALLPAPPQPRAARGPADRPHAPRERMRLYPASAGRGAGGARRRGACGGREPCHGV